MTRSRVQQEATALALMRQALADGWHTEALMVDRAVAAMGEDARAMVQRVYDKAFKVYPAS